MVEFKEMEKVITSLETKTESLADELSKAKEVLEMLREQYRSESSSGDGNVRKLILDRADELKKCCNYSYECFLAEEGPEKDLMLLSNVSKRKIKAKEVLLYTKMSHDYGSSRVYLCEDKVVLCALDDDGIMTIVKTVPYNAITDIRTRVTGNGDNTWFSVETEDDTEREIRGYGCHSSAFDVITTILWDCYEELS